MLGYFKLCILFSVHNSIVRCLIPALNVQKYDQDVIKKKRQDTLEMCRIFTSETEKKQNEKSPRQKPESRRKISFTANQLNKNYNKYRRRVKRSVIPEILGENPSAKLEDLKKVEDIVDRLYDDNQDNDNPVTYRKLDLDSLTTTAPNILVINNENASDPELLKSGRRSRFRPAVLLGPMEEGATPRTEIEAESYIPWPKLWKHGIVPYFIDPKTYDSYLSQMIMDAFDYIEKATCIRLQKLREKPRDKSSMHNVEWVYITNPSGIKQCVHSNEKKITKGVQMVVFGYDCMSTGEILHEMMHVLGFPHEHTRPDRDQHITVMWDNIKPGYKKYFALRKPDTLMSLNLPYDHASVLHYPARAFSKNGQMTLVSEQGVKLGQRDALSETDVAKVSLIYGAECVERNKMYLLTTCPSVVKSRTEPEVKATKQEIENYFQHRLWPYGIVNYKLRDPLEFSAEERENIKAVISHIEKETCIEFRDLTEGSQVEVDGDVGRESGEDTGNPKEPVKTSDEGFQDTVGNQQDESGTGREKGEESGNSTEPVNTLDIGFHDTQPVYHNAPLSLKVKSIKLPVKKVIHNQKLIHPDLSRLPDMPDSEIESNGLSSNEAQSSNDILANLVASGDKVVLTYYNLKDVEKNDTDKQSQNGGEKSNRVKRQASPASSKSPDASESPLSPISESPQSSKSPPRPPSPHRRHANSILVLTRSARSGCTCPLPGRVDGDKGLEISTDCFNTVNDLLHVFVHVLGLDHQHNMHDRDNYLRILWTNMTMEVRAEFEEKLPPAAAVGFPYDYLSVTHYPWLGIKNGNINLMYPVWNDGWAMGHWQGLSSTDVQKINLLYYDQCMERKKHIRR